MNAYFKNVNICSRPRLQLILGHISSMGDKRQISDTLKEGTWRWDCITQPLIQTNCRRVPWGGHVHAPPFPYVSLVQTARAAMAPVILCSSFEKGNFAWRILLQESTQKHRIFAKWTTSVHTALKRRWRVMMATPSSSFSGYVLRFVSICASWQANTMLPTFALKKRGQGGAASIFP